MMNQFVLVGRIKDTKKGKLKGKDVIQLTLAIPKSYKNEDGEFETDFIPIILSGSVAENTLEYCGKGDIVGIKGSLCAYEDSFYAQAERVTFLSSKAKDDKE